ncbi:hypothetical protein GCM10020254_80620 [Streptomyces goshikiensis]
MDWGLSVPDALEELISGRADSSADYAGCAYYAALQIIIDHNASDSSTLASYRSPVTYFSALDDALSSAGVPADLLPYQYVFSGPPSEIGFRIPHPLDGSPEIGCWPLAKAGPAVAAYRAVLDRVDADLRYDLGGAHRGPRRLGLGVERGRGRLVVGRGRLDLLLDHRLTH